MTSHVESVALGRYVEEPVDEEDASNLVIALYHEGVLTVEDADTVRSHIADCEECAARLSSLDEATSLLRTSPCPPLGDEFLARLDSASATLDTTHLPSLPPETARAIDERLAAEPPVKPTADDDAPRERSGSAQVLQLTPKTRFSRWTPFLVAAAAVVFVVGGGVAVLNSVFTDDAANAPHVAEPAPQDDPELAKPYLPHVVESGTGYSGDVIDTQVIQLLDTVDPGSDISDDNAATGGPHGAPTPPENLEQCVENSVANGEDHPFLVDIAEYDGATAWVLVDSAGKAPESAEEFHYRVVPASCGGTDSFEVLDEGTIPAP